MDVMERSGQISRRRGLRSEEEYTWFLFLYSGGNSFTHNNGSNHKKSFLASGQATASASESTLGGAGGQTTLRALGLSGLLVLCKKTRG